MKVKELIELLQDCDPEKEVHIDGKPIYSVEEFFFVSDSVEIYVDESAPDDEEMSDFFQRMSDTLDAKGDIFDMINTYRVQ